MSGQITENEVGQAFVHDPAPSPIEAAAAAIIEGDHLLDKLAEGYITFGSGDPEAEILRQLVESVQYFASNMGAVLASVRRYVDAVESEVGA